MSRPTERRAVAVRLSGRAELPANQRPPTRVDNGKIKDKGS